MSIVFEKSDDAEILNLECVDKCKTHYSKILRSMNINFQANNLLVFWEYISNYIL